MSKTKKPIEVGMKVEVEYVGRHRLERVTANVTIVEPDGSIQVRIGTTPSTTSLLYVTRRQITKVWRKKPKPESYEFEATWTRGGGGVVPIANSNFGPGDLSFQHLIGKRTRVRVEVIE